METNKKNQTNILLITSIVLMLLIQTNINAQPYYFYKNFISYKDVNINRINLNNYSELLFLEGIYPLTVLKEDSYQKWLITALDGQIKIFDLNNPLVIESFGIDQKYNKDLFVIAIPEKDLLFLSTSESENEWIYQTNIFHYQNLERIGISSLSMTPFSFASFNGDLIYQISEDSLGNAFIEKYSTELDSIISIRYLSTILTNIGYPTFEIGYLGKALFAYNEIPSDKTTQKYVVYDIENDNLFTPISYPYRSYGYLTPIAEYVLIQKALWAPELPGGENFTGEVNIYNPITGILLKELALPPDGKIMLFDNYPNNIYYVINIEEPTRQIYVLKMDSICNVLDLTSLDPSSKIVHSPPFTLTVNGHGFDTLSTVYFNDTAKATTYVSDSVLTAEVATSDISTVGDYPVWATDEWATSDTLDFSVIPVILSSISPGLTFTPSVLELDNGYPEFTVTAVGKSFTDSSIVYFNGESKSTTLISDTILTFQLNADDIPDAGDYAVWVSNYGSVSDTLLFTAADSLQQPITPFCNCIEGEKTAYFGYTNDYEVSVYIPVSGKNYFNPETPGPGVEYIDRGQPTVFLPGTHNSVFNIEFEEPIDDDIWMLDGERAEPNTELVPPCE